MTFEQLHHYIHTTWLPNLPKDVSMSVLEAVFDMQMAIFAKYRIAPSFLMDGFGRTAPQTVEELRFRLFELEKNLKLIY